MNMFLNTYLERFMMSPTIVNHEQSEYWNKKYGHKWVDNDNSMNERLTILTKALFLKTNIKKGDKVLDIGCGGGQTSFEASQLVGENGYVLGADISNLLLDLAKALILLSIFIDFGTPNIFQFPIKYLMLFAIIMILIYRCINYYKRL